MPSITVTSNIFVVIIVNPCIPPPNCIFIIGCGIPDPTVNPPSIDIEIEVTVTVDVVIELPPWNCGTPGCDTQVIVDCTINCDINGGGTVVIINNEINIHIDTCEGICVDSPNGNVIIIVLQGCLDLVCVPIDVPVIIYNPCLDPDMFQLIPVPLPQIDLELFTEITVSWSGFTVISTTTIIEICGELVYTINTEVGISITYDVDLQILIIYCTDMSLVVSGSITYTIDVTIVGYTDCLCDWCCGTGTGIIIIVDPCLTCTIGTGVTTNISITITYGVTGTFYVPTLTVIPEPCVVLVVYTCAYISGPYNGSINMCSFNIN
jgi:hypothetical protein